MSEPTPEMLTFEDIKEAAKMLDKDLPSTKMHRVGVLIVPRDISVSRKLRLDALEKIKFETDFYFFDDANQEWNLTGTCPLFDEIPVGTIPPEYRYDSIVAKL